jgi:hypothetical protein
MVVKGERNDDYKTKQMPVEYLIASVVVLRSLLLHHDFDKVALLNCKAIRNHSCHAQAAEALDPRQNMASESTLRASSLEARRYMR